MITKESLVLQKIGSILDQNKLRKLRRIDECEVSFFPAESPNKKVPVGDSFSGQMSKTDIRSLSKQFFAALSIYIVPRVFHFR